MTTWHNSWALAAGMRVTGTRLRARERCAFHPAKARERAQIDEMPEVTRTNWPKGEFGRAAGASRHGLGPLAMPLAAERSRRVAVAIPEVRISDVVAVSPRQQRAEALQQDVAHHEAILGGRSR